MDALLTTHSQPDSSFHLPTAADLHHTGATFWTQFACLCVRALNDVFRNPYKLRARIGQVLFVSIFAGLVYLQVGLGQSSIQNRSGVLFFLCAGGVMNSAMGTVAIFAGEKEVFVREFGARMYSLPSFFFSKLAMELPLRIIFPIMSAAIVYWMVRTRSRAKAWRALAESELCMPHRCVALMLLAVLCASDFAGRLGEHG
jgi:hypothetical protein